MSDRHLETHLQEWDFSQGKREKWDAAKRQWTLIRGLIEKKKPLKQGMKLLDLGCGSGWLAILASEDGLDGHGVDRNKGVIQYAKQTAETRGTATIFKIGDAETLDYPDNYFDVVCAVSIFEHVTDWVSALKEATRVLKPRGVLYLSTTNKLHPVSAECPWLPFYPWLPYRARHWVQKRRFGDDVDSFMDYHMFTEGQLKGKLADMGLSAYDLVCLLTPNDLTDMVGRRNPRLRRVGSKLLWLAKLPVLHDLSYLFIPAIFIVAVKEDP